MEELKNEQTEVSAQTAEAEKGKEVQKTEVSLGKFKDVSALLSAYNSLESEFTKRCQKIKELESVLNEAEKATPPQHKEAANNDRDITDEERRKILSEYLGGIIGRKQKAVFLGDEGVSVKTPINRPKTLKQAGELASEIFNK